MKNVQKFLKEIKVYDCNLTKIRIGNEFDGGYIALKELCEKTDLVYSFGIDKDIGFELDFVNKFPNSHIKLFDPTIDSLPNDHKKFMFWKLGVGRDQSSLEDIITLLDIGDTPERKLLKMDIEWDEWSTFLDADNETIAKFDQLIIEFHIVGINSISQIERPGFAGPHHILTPYFRRFYQSVYDKMSDNIFITYLKVLRKLNERFYIFHIHANNSLSDVKIDGYLFPPLIELSFVRKDLIDSVHETKETFPVPRLDFPNKTDRPDIELSYPLGVK